MQTWENLSIEPRDPVFFKSPLDYDTSKGFKETSSQRSVYENSLINSSFLLFNGQLKDFTYRMASVYKRNKTLKKVIVKNFSDTYKVFNDIKTSDFIRFNVFERFPRSEIGIEDILSLLEPGEPKTLGVCVTHAFSNISEAYYLILNKDRETKLSRDKFFLIKEKLSEQLMVCDRLIENRISFFKNIDTWFQGLIDNEENS